MPEVVAYQKRRAPTRKLLIYDASTRVLVRPIGLDMVEVGGSNPPGPTTRTLINTDFLLAGHYSHLPT